MMLAVKPVRKFVEMGSYLIINAMMEMCMVRMDVLQSVRLKRIINVQEIRRINLSVCSRIKIY